MAKKTVAPPPPKEVDQVAALQTEVGQLKLQLEEKDVIISNHEVTITALELLTDDETELVVTEETVVMYWPGDVDTYEGADPVAWGRSLQQDEDGNWFANVPESQVAVEEGRERGPQFTLDAPNTIDEDEAPPVDEE